MILAIKTHIPYDTGLSAPKPSYKASDIMPTDTRHMKFRNHKWYFERRVPVALSSHHPEWRGRKTISIATGTSDIIKARQFRDIENTKLAAALNELEGEQANRKQFLDTLSELRRIKDDLELDDSEIPPTLTDVIDVDSWHRAGLTERVDAYRVVANNREIPKKYAYSIRDALKSCLKRKSHLAPKTQGKYPRAVELLCEHYERPDIPLSHLKRLQVGERFVDPMLESYKGSTLQGHLGMLSQIWKHAETMEHISDRANPFTGHDVPNDTVPYQRFNEGKLHDIANRFLAEADSTDKKNYGNLLIDLLWATGARREELAGLEVEEVKVAANTGIVYFDIQEGKTESAGRWLPAPRRTWEAVLAKTKQAQERGSKYVFYELEECQNIQGMGDKFGKWFGRVKAKGAPELARYYCLHSFRSHAATRFERGDAREEIAASVLGHKRGKSMAYGRYSDGPKLQKLLELTELAPPFTPESFNSTKSSPPEDD